MFRNTCVNGSIIRKLDSIVCRHTYIIKYDKSSRGINHREKLISAYTT